MTKITVLVFGATGMLGASIFRYLSKCDDWEVVGTTRERHLVDRLVSRSRGEVVSGIDARDTDSVDAVIQQVRPKFVINCVGLVKQVQAASSPCDAVQINSLFPHQLARLCKAHGAKLIHFSTDCVFSGAAGPYCERSIPDASDLYGRSKLLGEVFYDGNLTLRTSIIGHELASNRSLVNWFLAQSGRVNGYRRAIFSGLPTIKIAQLLDEYFLRVPISGLYHLSGDPINKHDLLRGIRDRYGRHTEIEPSDTYITNKSLDSRKLRKELGLQVDAWPALIDLMHSEYQAYFEGNR